MAEEKKVDGCSCYIATEYIDEVVYCNESINYLKSYDCIKGWIKVFKNNKSFSAPIETLDINSISELLDMCIELIDDIECTTDKLLNVKTRKFTIGKSNNTIENSIKRIQRFLIKKRVIFSDVIITDMIIRHVKERNCYYDSNDAFLCEDANYYIASLLYSGVDRGDMRAEQFALPDCNIDKYLYRTIDNYYKNKCGSIFNVDSITDVFIMPNVIKRMVVDLLSNINKIEKNGCSKKISLMRKSRSNQLCLGNCFSELGEVNMDEYIIKKGRVVNPKKRVSNDSVCIKRGPIKKKIIINKMNKGFIVDNLEDTFIDEKKKYNYIVNGYYYTEYNNYRHNSVRICIQCDIIELWNSVKSVSFECISDGYYVMPYILFEKIKICSVK